MQLGRHIHGFKLLINQKMELVIVYLPRMMLSRMEGLLARSLMSKVSSVADVSCPANIINIELSMISSSDIDMDSSWHCIASKQVMKSC